MDGSPITVLRAGRVRCADGTRAEAIAIRDDTVLAIGSDAELAGLHAAETVDLAGRAVLPGFVDAHVHPVLGGVEMSRCDLTGTRTAAEAERVVAGYAAAHPDLEWITGGGWSMASFPGGRPAGSRLDAVAGDRPVFLINRDHHSAWVSTAALRAAGIHAGTPDPADGRIERDAAGEPTGLLHEGAMALVDWLLPETSDDQYADGLRVAQRYLHSLGIVAWQDAWVHVDGPESGVHRAYLAADRDGWLTAQVVGAMWWDRTWPEERIGEQVARLVAARDEAMAGARHYRPDAVKVMQDGVAETFTAGLLEPYLDAGGRPTGNRGLSFLAPPVLGRVVGELVAAGFHLHFHALGDRAVREVLDALAGHAPTGDRHQLAHLQVVHPDDIPRFAALGAIANLQPLWACHEPQMDDLTIPFLGAERSRLQYPFAALQTAGAHLAMGSDWPVSSPDPLLGLHTAVNRIAPDAPAGTPPLETAQRLSPATALTAYTAGSRSALGLGPALAVGARADLVVLDRDPFAGPAEAIHTARVHRTYAGGRLVHQAE
jgi:predicted amidohydrolase YtcJ